MKYLDRLGVFYTNNNINDNVINKSISTIDIASKKSGVTILSSVWRHISNNPFYEKKSFVKVGNHFNIIYQILSLLLIASEMKKFKYVSFLEHDVLYGEDYFTFDDFSDEAIFNSNFIGWNGGYQKKIQYDKPLHQMTMNFDYALSHFKKILIDNILEGHPIEPLDIDYKEWISPQKSIHIYHGKHFTSHYNIYDKSNLEYDDEYWGDAISLIHL